MNLKQKIKPGICRKMRCTKPDLGEGFCEAHIDQARTEGLLGATQTNLPNTGIEGIRSGDTGLLVHETGDKVYDVGMAAGIAAVEAENTSSEALLPSFTQAVAANTEATYKERLSQYLEYLPVFEIQNQEDMDALNAWLDDIKEIGKGIDTELKKITVPLNAGLKAARALFKPLQEAASKAEQLAKDKIATKLRADKEARIAALKQVEASGGDTSQEILTVAHGQNNVQAPSNVSMRTFWDVEIYDEKAVPAAFCSPDIPRLQAFAQQTNGQTPVPGVRFIPRDSVTHRKMK